MFLPIAGHHFLQYRIHSQKGMIKLVIESGLNFDLRFLKFITTVVTMVVSIFCNYGKLSRFTNFSKI